MRRLKPLNLRLEGPPRSTELTDPELQSDNQPLTTGSQLMDLLAAVLSPVYTTKGKSKELRGILGTTRDVGNTAQREFQPR